MKIILILSILCASTLIGVKLSNNIKKKEKIFSDLRSFCALYESNLQFKMDTVDNLFVSRETEYCEDFANYYKKYFRKIDQKTANFLNENEEKNVKDFFLILGNSDALTQKSQIGYYKDYFEGQLNIARSNVTTKSPVAIKICILAGFLLAIMII